MGLRAKLRSTGKGKGVVLAKAFAATNLVSYKTGAGGGQAIFGVTKQVVYVKDTLGIPIHPKVETAYMAVVVTFTIITSILTRGGNTFRQLLGKMYLYTLGILKAPPVAEEALPVQVRIGPPAEPNVDRALNADIAQLSNEDEEANLEDELKHADEPVNALIEEENEEDDDDEEILEALIDPFIQPSTLRLGLQITIDSFVSACSLTSTLFTTINSYNFGINFMGYVESIDPNTRETSDSVTTGMLVLLEIGALAMTIGNFYSNFYYNSAKARAYGFRFANWVTNLECVDVASDVISMQLDPEAEALPPATMKEAEKHNTPILIKQANEFYIYGCQEGSWGLVEVLNITPKELNALEKLNFKKPIIKIKNLDEPLMNVVKRGHSFDTTLVRTEYNHLTDIWSYRYAVGLTFINFSFSEPANAFFTTMNSIVVVPYVTAVFAEDTLQEISAFSTATSVIQNISTNVPSIKNLLHPEQEIQAALDRLPSASKRLLRFGQICGAEDSLITAFSYFIAIVYTLNKMNRDISLTNPYSMAVAAFCGAIKGLSNQAFSVNPALIELMEDIHPDIFKEERDKAKALRAAKAAGVQVLPSPKKKESPIAVEMQTSRSKKKRVQGLGDDLHESLLSFEEEKAANASGSEDDDSTYQVPSFHRGVGLPTAQSSPNLNLAQPHSSQKHTPLRITHSPQGSLQVPSDSPPLDFYSGIAPQGLVIPDLRPSSIKKASTPVSGAADEKEFEEKKYASSVKRIFSHLAAGDNHAVSVCQSEPLRKHTTYAHARPPLLKLQIPARIVHSSHKAVLFSRNDAATSSSRKMATSVNLEELYGRTSFELF